LNAQWRIASTGIYSALVKVGWGAFNIVVGYVLVLCVWTFDLRDTWDARSLRRRLAVDPARQRGGVGGGLMRAVEEAMFDRGIEKVNLQVWHDNQQVAAFYESVFRDLVSC
jgi:ribosomal protein S18 acetylase RimI-like enzyme